MGSAAARAVALPGGLRPPQQIRHRGKLVWVLWDVDNLLQFDQRYASMLALLRDALRHFFALAVTPFLLHYASAANTDATCHRPVAV